MTHGFFVLWVKALLAAKAPCSAHFNIFQQCARLARYVRCGRCQETLSLSEQLHIESIVPDTTFKFMSTWKRAHTLLSYEVSLNWMHRWVVVLSTCVPNMQAWRMLSVYRARSPLSWMLGLVKCRQGQMALDFYQQLQQEGVEPTTVTFVGVLSACASIAALDEGVHVPKWIWIFTSDGI